MTKGDTTADRHVTTEVMSASAMLALFSTISHQRMGYASIHFFASTTMQFHQTHINEEQWMTTARRSSSDTEAVIIIGAIALVALCIGAYLLLKSWADALGLSVESIVWLIAGIGLVGIITYFVFRFEINPGKALPWLLPLFGMFTLPALTDKAQPKVGPFAMSLGAADPSWYGTWWGQLIIIAALCAVAFGLMMKYGEESY